MYTRLPVHDGHTSDIAVFNDPSTNSAQTSTSYVTVRPISHILSNLSVLEFVYPASTKYVDLAETQLYLKVRIVKSDGSTIPKGSDVAFVNNPLASLFSNIELLLNNVPVSRIANNLYPIQSYIDIMTNNLESSFFSYLECRQFVKDTAGFMDDCTIAKPGGIKASSSNEGFASRARKVAESQPVELMGRIHLDIMKIDRFLLSNVTMSLKFYQASEAFRLSSSESNPDYKVEILDSALHVKTVTIAPEIVLSQESVLQTKPAVYPYWGTHYRTFTVSKGDQNLVVDSLFGSRIPSKIFVVMLDSEAYNGNPKKSPLHFQTFGLNRFALSINGQIYPSGKILTPDFDAGLYTELYLSFLATIGHLTPYKGPELSYSEFAKGYCIIAIDCDGHPVADIGYLPIEGEGVVSLEMGFSKALAQSINVVVIGHLISVLHIDAARNVVLA